MVKLMMPRCAVLAAALIACPAFAQRSADNAVTAAEDAFGTSVGYESIGLYSISQVRGFSPVTAGNVRLEDLYIDRQSAITPRLSASSAIRVGLSAQGYLFPAPTGLVNYRLRNFGDHPVVSAVAGSYSYGAPTVEVDAQIPIDGKALGFAAGFAWTQERYNYGGDARYVRAAIIPRWRPRDGIEIIPFWSIVFGNDEQVAPTILTAGNHAPPKVIRAQYFGQDWAAKDSRTTNSGLIAKARFGSGWSIASGVFRSSATTRHNYTELFLQTDPAGQTRERVIADPGQNYASISGEMRIGRTMTEGPRSHALFASLRARRLNSLYGGAAAPVDLPASMLGAVQPIARPPFSFSERTSDHVRQVTGGLAYRGRWKSVAEIGLGVQRTDYRKAVDIPGAVRSSDTRDSPWLFNGSATLHPLAAVDLYASYTRGLEDSGLAPANAANRNEALPAIHTEQTDAGIRLALGRGFKVVAGVFDVRKPYFNTDEANRFAILGDVRHRGAELSLSGNPTDRLSVVAGAVLMRPRVSGIAVDQGRVGRRPLGQAARIVRANADYRVPMLPGFSVDLAVSNYGKRPASRDNKVLLAPYTIVDIGARYRFRMAGAPSSFRLQMSNVGNVFAWNVVGSNSYAIMDKRRIIALLAADF